MRPLSSLGLGLSLVFGCLVMALLAEMYYLLWWRKRKANRDMEDDSTGPPLGLCCCCWRKPSLWRSAALNPREFCFSMRRTEGCEDAQHQARSSTNREVLIRHSGGEDGVEAEIMDLNSFSGPARFLFTIKEETKGDLESEDGRSRGEESRKGSSRRSMVDVGPGLETPFFTPLSSPPFFTPMGCASPHGFSPPSEPWKEDDRRRIRSSPPPKLKFLKDAEEKLYRKTLMEEAMRVHRNGALLPPAAAPVASGSSTLCSEEGDGPSITAATGKSKEQARHQHHSSLSQVIPLPPSPPNVGRSPQAKPISH